MRSYRTLSLRGEQSCNLPSTTSWLIFDYSLSSFHHHLGPPHHKSPVTTPNNLTVSPSLLLRDVGSPTNATAPSEARMQPQPPLPFPKGCGRLIFAWCRNWGGRKTRGGPRKWEAQVVRHQNKRRLQSLFIFSHLSLQPTDLKPTTTATVTN